MLSNYLKCQFKAQLGSFWQSCIVVLQGCFNKFGEFFWHSGLDNGLQDIVLNINQSSNFA
jgi:hypothetical protein